MLTDPPIQVAQNRDDSLRMLSAQARLYSDVKRAQWLRLGAVAVLGGAVAAVSLSRDDNSAIGAVGGVVLLFFNGLLMYRERRRAGLAVAIQESFDCSVFGLEWNGVVVRHHPSGQQISQAAERYTGSRARNWYPQTGSLQRPLDIAVCQQSNVGWGGPVHRSWAWSVVGISAVVALAIAVGWWMAGLSVWKGFDGLVVPFLTLAWEAFEMARQNFESAAEKEETQALILDDWERAISGSAALTVTRCRRFQDCIVGIRSRNAQVPDWFDKRLRGRNERAMRATADDMINQARRAGLA